MLNLINADAILNLRVHTIELVHRESHCGRRSRGEEVRVDPPTGLPERDGDYSDCCDTPPGQRNIGDDGGGEIDRRMNVDKPDAEPTSSEECHDRRDHIAQKWEAALEAEEGQDANARETNAEHAHGLDDALRLQNDNLDDLENAPSKLLGCKKVFPSLVGCFMDVTKIDGHNVDPFIDGVDLLNRGVEPGSEITEHAGKSASLFSGDLDALRHGVRLGVESIQQLLLRKVIVICGHVEIVLNERNLCRPLRVALITTCIGQRDSRADVG